MEVVELVTEAEKTTMRIIDKVAKSAKIRRIARKAIKQGVNAIEIIGDVEGATVAETRDIISKTITDIDARNDALMTLIGSNIVFSHEMITVQRLVISEMLILLNS